MATPHPHSHGPADRDPAAHGPAPHHGAAFHHGAAPHAGGPHHAAAPHGDHPHPAHHGHPHAGHPHPPHHPHHSHRHDPHHQELLAQWRAHHDQQNRVAIRNGLLWLAGLAVAMGIGGALWLDHLEQRQAERDAQRHAHEALRAELLATDALAPEHAAALVQRLQATRTRWAAAADAVLFERQLEQAQRAVAALQQAEVVRREVQALQQASAAAAEARDLATWRALHEREAALRARLPRGDAALATELDQTADQIDSQWIDALLHAAAPDTAPAAALGHLTEALELANAMLAAPHHDPGHELFWHQRLHGVVGRLDAAQAQAYDAAAIAAAPWQDLLPGGGEADWVPSRGAELSRLVSADRLQLECAAGERARSAVVVQRTAPWHAAVLAGELQLDRGEVHLFGRAAREFDLRSGAGVAFATGAVPGAVQVPAGRPIAFSIQLVGNELRATLGTEPPQQLVQHLTHDERRGTLALVLRPGTAVVLRQLRVKRLG